MLFLAHCSQKFGPGRLKGSPSWPSSQDELFECDRLEAMAGAARISGATILVLKEDEMELFRTDAELLIPIDPVFVGFLSSFRTASYFGFVCLSFP